jgi:hypothetical protein
MSNKLFYSSPRARFADTNYNPLAFGRVSFYEAGTTTLKTIYTDSENSTPLPNPFLLDGEGYVVEGGVWMGAGKYKMKLEKPLVIPPDILEDGDFSELWTIDNIEGSTQLSSGELKTIVVGTISDLRGLTAGEYSLVYVAGYWEVNDGGGGWFNYDSNGFETDNGGTIISPNGSPQFGRYYRNLENWETSAQYFGATSTATSVVDGYVQNCLTWCLANAQTMVFPSDQYTFGTTQTYQGDLTIRIKENAVFNGEIPIELHFEPQNLEVEGVTNHLGTDLVLYLAPIVPNSFRPEHWGAVGGTNNDLDWQGFANADGRYSDSTLILSANYKPFIPSGSLATEFSIQKAHLLKKGSLETDASVSLSEYTFEEGVNTFWLFDIINLGTYSMNKLYLDHFKNFTSLSDSDFVVLANAVTNTNTRHGTLNLLTGGSYSVNTISALGGYSLDLYIKTGNSIKAVGASNLPRLLNNVGDFGILDNAGDTIKLQGDKHSVLWWGASNSTNSATTKVGITKAIESASLASKRGWVTGNNESLNLTSESITLTSPNIELVDFKFSNTSGFFITFSGGDLRAYNCAFTGLAVTAGTNYTFENCEISGDTSTSIVASIIEVSRCNFELSSSLTLTLTATLELYYEGNRSSSGRFDFTTGSSTNVISNNRFNGLIRQSGTATQNLMIIRGGGKTKIGGNVMQATYDGTVASTTIFIAFIGSLEIIKGLVCNGNTLDYTLSGGANQTWQSFVVSGYADQGHSASIKDNIYDIELIGFAGTERHVIMKNPGSNDSTFVKTLPLLFPSYIGAFVYGDPPLFYINGSADGYLSPDFGNLHIDSQGVTGTGGNCVCTFDLKLASAASTSQYASIFVSVQNDKTDLIFI